MGRERNQGVWVTFLLDAMKTPDLSEFGYMPLGGTSGEVLVLARTDGRFGKSV